MNISIRLANEIIVFQMKAEYNTLTVDIKNLHVNHDLTNIILVHLFITYAMIIFYFIKITFNMMDKCLTFQILRMCACGFCHQCNGSVFSLTQSVYKIA
jgi:hypothetical protein